MAKNFVCVADEVQGIFPEGAASLARVKGRADHEFFNRFGTQVPSQQWFAAGTKQGIYAIGPNSEYLGARRASPGAADVRAMLTEALARWEQLKREKGYVPKALPKITTRYLDSIIDGGLRLQVNSRDLPRTDGTLVGKRFSEVPNGANAWPEFVKWAWNQNWLQFSQSEMEQLIPAKNGSRDWPSTMAKKLAREALVDNVRGQCPPWRDENIQRITLTNEWLATGAENITMRIRGSAAISDGAKSYDCSLFGKATYNIQSKRFVHFELASVGTRRGAWIYNGRERDPGPAPMGISFIIENQSVEPPKN